MILGCSGALGLASGSELSQSIRASALVAGAATGVLCARETVLDSPNVERRVRARKILSVVGSRAFKAGVI